MGLRLFWSGRSLNQKLKPKPSNPRAMGSEKLVPLYHKIKKMGCKRPYNLENLILAEFKAHRLHEKYYENEMSNKHFSSLLTTI